LNSTLKSLLFWMVLIVVGVLIWQFSTSFQRTEAPMPFSQFLKKVDNGEVVTPVLKYDDLVDLLTVVGALRDAGCAEQRPPDHDGRRGH